MVSPYHASLYRIYVAPANYTKIANYNSQKDFRIAQIIKINSGGKEPFWLHVSFYKGLKEEPE